MKIFQHKKAIKNHLIALGKKTIGFVPTMGALHDGHLSLVQKSVENNDYTVISIFVNPTQFDNASDLNKYPKTLEKDLSKLKSVSKELIIFTPTVDEIYASNIVSSKFDFGGIEFEMEGKHRIGHFDGVGTIIKRFFEIIEPANAYFGEKDYQQLQIVKALVENYKIPVNIVGCAILREKSGLAMSSRNERLTAHTREEASIIYKTLEMAKNKFGTESAVYVTEWVKKQFENHPIFDLEYFEIADATTLKIVKRKVTGKKYRAFIAIYANEIRLIDNIALN